MAVGFLNKKNMEVTLLKDLGDHKKGDVLVIHDETVIEKWKELGVIADDKPKNTKDDKKQK